MKTQKNIRNLKKLSITVFATLMLATGSYHLLAEIPENASTIEDASVSMERLDVFVERAESMLKYQAPESDEVIISIQRLEAFAALSETSLQYVAPTPEEVSPEMERLEQLLASVEVSLKYKAPVEVGLDVNEPFNNCSTGTMLIATK